MSLRDALASAFEAAHAETGGEYLSIADGPEVAAIGNQADLSRDYETEVHSQDRRSTAVIPAGVFEAAYPGPLAAHIGERARWRGLLWRVEAVRPGVGAVAVEMTGSGQAA